VLRSHRRHEHSTIPGTSVAAAQEFQHGCDSTDREGGYRMMLNFPFLAAGSNTGGDYCDAL